MPVHKVKGGWKYGTKSKVYKSKERQDDRGELLERVRIEKAVMQYDNKRRNM